MRSSFFLIGGVVLALAASASAAAAGSDGAGASPDEWARLVLTPCAEAAARTQASDDRLAGDIARSAPSREQRDFLRRERAARSTAIRRQRAVALARMDALLFGAKFETSETDRRSDAAGRAEPVRRLLRELFGTADPCALEALETTVLLETFGIPFSPASVALVGPSREFRGVAEQARRLVGDGRSIPQVFEIMRPAAEGEAIAFVKAVAWAAMDPEPGGKPGAREPRLALFLQAVRLAAEPLRIQAYLRSRIEELEGGLGTPVPESAATRLLTRAEDALYADIDAMRALGQRDPAGILDDLAPILDRWFRRTALDAIRASLARDPFAAYWFFVQSGAVPGAGPLFPGSRVRVDAAPRLSSLASLTFDDALARFRSVRIPAHYLERHAELEKALAEARVSRVDALAGIAELDISPQAREKLRRFVDDGAGASGLSALDAYGVMIRDASKIRGRADWDTLAAGLDLVHASKRRRLDELLGSMPAAETSGDPRLAGYLESAGALMLELERRQLRERRFQQRTSGAFVGWLLSQFMMSGGVPVELWAPGGVTGDEFAAVVDALTPKNRASGNDYRGKPPERIHLVHDGREYHDALLRVIDTARQFINIAAFDWKTDAGGRDIAYRLMAKKLGIDGERYQRFLSAFGGGLRLDPAQASATPFYDIPTTRVKDLLVWFFVMESTSPEIVEAREAARQAGATLRCDTVRTCGDLSGLFTITGEHFRSEEPSPEYHRAWRAYLQLQGLFTEHRGSLADVRPRPALRDYGDDPAALRRFVRAFGSRRADRPEEPLPINMIADAKQTLFNIHPGDRSGYFPYVFSDPIRDIYFPLLEFDVHLVLWKGPLEYPWHAGPLPLPGRKILRRIPMPFIPYPWIGMVPGFGSVGPVSSIVLQYLLASDPRIFWAMVSHTKSWSNEAMALESGMGMGTKYFNVHEDYQTWHDTGVLVQGPPVADVNDHFVQVFNQARVNNAGVPASRGVAVGRLRYEDYRASPPLPAAPGQSRAWLLTTHPEEGDSNYRGVFLAAMAAARTSIHIENSFFSDPLVARMLMRKAREFRGRVSCDGLADFLCAERRRKGVLIHLVLPDASDKPVVDAVGAADFYEMLHLGIKVHRWTPRAGWSATRMLHTKAWLIDFERGRGGLTYVGAANATQRSHLADNEAGILSTSSDFADEVYTRVFERDIDADSSLEGPEGFHLAWSASPVMRASRWLRRFLVDLLWFI